MRDSKLNEKRNRKSKSQKKKILSHKIRFAYNNADDFLQSLFSLNEQGSFVIGGRRIC